MNILFITPSFPSTFHRIRAVNLIKAYSKNHQVHLLSFSTTQVDEKDHDEMRKYCASISILYKPKWQAYFDAFISLFTFSPAEVGYCKSSEMEKEVEKIVNNQHIDRIYIKRLRSAQYVKHQTVPVSLDTTDAISLFYKRAAVASTFPKKLFYRSESWKYRRFEKKISTHFKEWITCSKEDAEYIKSIILPDCAVKVIPNVVDLNSFRYSSESPNNTHILFSGLMDKLVNVEAALFFIRDIFPLILTKVPEVILYIVGPHPHSSLLPYASKHIIITGEVPDIYEYIKNATVVVCPIKTGTGTRNKILQALATGRPVVSTRRGAEGIELISGKHILIGDTPEQFKDMVINLFNDQELWHKLSKEGRLLIEENYSLRSIVS